MIKNKIKIRSTSTQWLLEQKTSRETPIFKVSLFKITEACKDARSRYLLHAWMHLLETVAKSQDIETGIRLAIRFLEERFKEKKVNLSQYKIPVIATYEFTIANSTVGVMIKLIQDIDKLNSLYYLARSLPVIRTGENIHAKINKVRKDLHSLIMFILSFKNDPSLPATIDDFLENHPRYIKYAEIRGAIKPAGLYNAINLSALPSLPPGYKNQVVSKLRKMA